jgi:hypothetical protein
VFAERPPSVRRFFVRIWAMLPEHWRGAAGERFRQTTGAITDYATEHVRIGERLSEAPDLAWRAVEGAASQKHSEAVLFYSKDENARIKNDLERRTLEHKVRRDGAEASRAESEARLAEIREIEARIELVDKLRRLRCVPVWRADGTMIITRAPSDFDWDELVSERLIGPVEQNSLFGDPIPEVRDAAASTSGVSATTAVGQVEATLGNVMGTGDARLASAEIAEGNLENGLGPPPVTQKE